ncbi:MAG: hypothetical protein ACE15E_25235 [Acidobacteriota bacterium]
MRRFASFTPFTFLIAITACLLLPSSAAFAQQETVSVSDYFPVEPHPFCKRIYNFTFGATGSFTNQIVGSLTAPYSTQSLTGALYCGFGADISLSAWYNDGQTVLNILDGDHYPSTDCSMSAFPQNEALQSVHDGQLISLSAGGGIIVRKDLGGCDISGDADETLLIRIEDVTAGGRIFQRAVVVWFLQNDQPYLPLNFQGKDLNLGISLPDASATGGRLAFQFFILGYREGVIAGGGIDEESGSLTYLFELTSVDCSAGPTWDVFDVPGYYSTLASGINDSGDVVGSVGNPGMKSRSFLRRAGVSNLLDLSELGAASSVAQGINNNGDIVGFFDDSLGRHGYLLRNGSYTKIDAPGELLTVLSRINDYGDIVGSLYTTSGAPSKGFMLRNGVFTSIQVPGALWTEAIGLNDNREVVGNFADASGVHGFVTSAGTYNTIDYPGAVMTRLGGIDNHGNIVGRFRQTPDSPVVAFARVRRDFLAIRIPCAGQFIAALDINRKGEIVGNFNAGSISWSFIVSGVTKGKEVRDVLRASERRVGRIRSSR